MSSARAVVAPPGGHGGLQDQVGITRQGGGVGELVVQERMEQVQPVLGQAEPGGHGVATARGQQPVPPGCEDGGAEVHPLHGPAGALDGAAAAGPGEGGAVLPLLDAPGHDAHHAGMPALAVDEQHGAAGFGLAVRGGVGGVHHRGLQGLALVVDRIQPGRQGAGLEPGPRSAAGEGPARPRRCGRRH